MSPNPASGDPVPEAVLQTLDDFRARMGVDLRAWRADSTGDRVLVFPSPAPEFSGDPVATRVLMPRDALPLHIELYGAPGDPEAFLDGLMAVLERVYESAQEVRFFTYELSERYEEINLLYSISETLGSILELKEAARNILSEVSDVMGARRGSLWVYDPAARLLRLTAWVGEKGLDGPIPLDDRSTITARVFRDGRSLILTGPPDGPDTPDHLSDPADSILSVPIRYTPPTGEAKTVGVLNLIGRRREGRFTASDQKLLSAIASQVGAALENNRLIQQSLAQERVRREMELAHDLQKKLLPPLDGTDGAMVAARVEPAVSVGGDFYHLFEFPGGRTGIMIGDVSGHGFPAALIMALSLSAASIYASEKGKPAQVLRQIHDALEDELESTETYLTVFYGVIDPAAGVLEYSNAGHPHAFVVSPGGTAQRLPATDPPLGIAGPDSYHDQAVAWASGKDLLFLFTDGLSDTLAVPSITSGEDVVMDEVVRRREQRPEDIVDGLLDLARDATPSIPADDRTAIALRI